MKYMKKLALLLCAMMLTLGLMACGKATNNATTQGSLKETTVEATDSTEGAKTQTDATETVSSTDAATATAVVYPVTITDSEGTQITIDAKPLKVVSMAPNITELMFQLGISEKLIGRTDYCDYPAEALNIESVGTLQTPDIEKIVSLNPDVVIASTHFSEESEKQLTDLGIKVIVLYEEHDISGVYTMIETLGTIFDVQNKAEETITQMKTTTEEATKAVDGLEAPSVYYVVGFGEYGDYTAGGDTFIGQLITLAGGKNIAQDVSGWSYTLESLLEADPDIIVIDNSMKDSFMTADNYKELTAVKNGTVYGIDKSILERQGYRNAEGIKTLATLFHPEAFK